MKSLRFIASPETILAVSIRQLSRLPVITLSSRDWRRAESGSRNFVLKAESQLSMSTPLRAVSHGFVNFLPLFLDLPCYLGIHLALLKLKLGQQLAIALQAFYR